MGVDEIYLEWGAGAMTHRARFASIDEALVQARHDLGLGLDVFRIAGPDPIPKPGEDGVVPPKVPGTGKTLRDLDAIRGA